MSIANDLERQMLDLINEERAARGLNPLKLELNLNQSSEDHSSWMLQTGTFSHTGVGGSSSRDRMADADFDFSGRWTSAENIAWQSQRGAPGLSDDVVDLHNSLMNSPGHRANILNPDHEVIGIGIEVGKFRGYDSVMVTQNFASTDGTVDLDRGAATPAAPAQVEETPVQQPVEDTPVQKAPVEEAPVQKAPVQETPEETAPVTKPAVEDTPVVEAPVAKPTVEETPIQETPVAKAPVIETPDVVETTAVEEGRNWSRFFDDNFKWNVSIKTRHNDRVETVEKSGDSVDGFNFKTSWGERANDWDNMFDTFDWGRKSRDTKTEVAVSDDDAGQDTFAFAFAGFDDWFHG
ncbi:CAP domain-containing protein [Limimaricola variabilis]